jgi:tetratricopeptide (TPR) repeat protein
MNQQEIQSLYNRINSDVTSGKLKPALSSLQQFIKESAKNEFYLELETLTDNYRNLLKYSIEGYHDPKEQSIYNGIASSILSIADEVYQTVMLRYMPMKRAEKARLSALFGNDPSAITNKIEEFLFSKELNQLIGGQEHPGENEIDNIFKLIWLTEKINDDLVTLAGRICHSETVDWPEKSLVVSALTLSLLNYFDIRKFFLLVEFIREREHQVYQRALTGLVLAMIMYDDRLDCFPDLSAKLTDLASDENLMREFELAFLQILIARETEKITHEFETEVLPDMQKMMPGIEEKLELGDLQDDPDMEGKNPGWKDMIEEVPGLFEKIEKFSKMQMEGSDVFMGTFSLLKRFDFFNSMSNWFIPFYKENPALLSAFPPGEAYHERLFDGLENAFYICNSDKYSFALNFIIVPAPQRSMIVTYFEAELGQMKEMASEEQILDQSLVSNAVIVQYIQDLYRFFKLFPNKSEFTDIFQEKMNFPELWFFKTFFERQPFTEKLGAFYFDKEHWTEAIGIYKYLTGKTKPRADFFEKTAYAYQMLGKYREAIGFYEKAELFDSNRLWILTKLGWCYSKLGDHDESIRYFKLALQAQPDDIKLQLKIAKGYMNKQNFEEALHIYKKLSFFDQADLKVLRPYAYTLFVLGKMEAAEEIYQEITEKGKTGSIYDLMNAGHVMLCLGKKKEALEYYRQSFMIVNNWNNFFRIFEEDRKYLLIHGVKANDIQLMLDYLMFSFEEE